MTRIDGRGILAWVSNGLDSIVLGASANAAAIVVGSKIADSIPGGAGNAIAGGLTALALVPVNYSISSLSTLLEKYDQKSRTIVSALFAGAVASLYLGLSSFTSPPPRSGTSAERALPHLTPTPPPQELNLSEIYEKHKDVIDHASAMYKVPVSLIVANIYVESRGNPLAVSCTGAAGLMQLTVGTAKSVGVVPGDYDLVQNSGYKCRGRTDWTSTWKGCNYVDTSKCEYQTDQRFDPDRNILGGTKNLRQKWNVRRNWEDALTDNAGGDTTYYATVWKLKETFERGQRTAKAQ